MHKINILDNKTINKIAAGEVVERPASVVKELVENSIDARATAVTVEIKNGGISFIRITDNGTGIPKSDVKTAFVRHATSKIKDERDLSNILSLGFRGEALASIAAVSEVEVVTKEHDELTGNRMQIDGGVITEESEVGCPEGTTMIVKNIFYNTPARRKFLKAEATEASFVDEIVSKMALGHPEISFKFINNNNIVFYTSGNNDLNNVIFNIYGREITKKLLEINEYENNIKIEGFIGKPEVNRANRMYENFFVNGRYVKSKVIENAFEEAFKPYLMTKRFPFCVLRVNVLPDEVDVNVHPTKIEVRFKEEAKVNDTLYKAIKQILENQLFVVDIPLVQEKEEKIEYNSAIVREAFEVENYKIGATSPLTPLHNVERGTVGAVPCASPLHLGTHGTLDDSGVCSNVEGTIVPPRSLEGNQLSLNKEELFTNYRIIGQVFNTYWIIEKENSMYIVDQHAAHEKVLYEKMIKQFESDNIVSQQLLQSMVIEVSLREKEVILNNLDTFKKLGFEIEEFGINAFAIREVPIIFSKPTNAGFFLDIVDEMIANEVSNVYQNKKETIANIACKSAVKANDKMSFEESKKMLDDLMNLENPFFCPHGRPIIISMNKYEMEKKFKRIV